MNEQIEKLIEKIVEDYRTFDPESEERVNEFRKNLSWREGAKYIKILSGSSVWGFVVNTDSDKKFRKGDILKSASFSTPARNKPRGNVFDEYSVRWTGPYYLNKYYV